MKKLLIFLMIVSFIFISCGHSQSNLLYGYRETPLVTDTEYCGPAEKHLKELCVKDPQNNLHCCQVSESTKRGKSFEQFCVETQNSGVMINPRCLSLVQNCGDIDFCLGTRR